MKKWNGLKNYIKEKMNNKKLNDKNSKTQRHKEKIIAPIPKTRSQTTELDSIRGTTSQQKDTLKRTRVTFPFKWDFGEIRKLSNAEKKEVNRPRYIRKKPYQKLCALCGEEGCIEFRKQCNGNSSLICESCAEQYVLSATRLMEKGISEHR